jgi:hypothetical protein
MFSTPAYWYGLPADMAQNKRQVSTVTGDIVLLISESSKLPPVDASL